MDAQTLRAETFKALHERDRAFVMPNPWDAGSAVMLASLGFEALATTSAGYAFSLARPDAEGALSLEDTLINASMIAKATTLPVAAVSIADLLVSKGGTDTLILLTCKRSLDSELRHVQN